MHRKKDNKDSETLLARLLRMNPSFERYVQLYPSVSNRLSEISRLNDPEILTKIDTLQAMIDSRDKGNSDWFAQRYRLTPVQARVATHLMAGGTAAGYARESGTSLHTVRTHVKAVFRKTGVSRQAELAHLLHNKRANNRD